MLKEIYFEPITLFPGDVGVIVHYPPNALVKPFWLEVPVEVDVLGAWIRDKSCSITEEGDEGFSFDDPELIGPNQPFSIHLKNISEETVTFRPLLTVKEERLA